jgi:tRNA pseudouridine55 synthase
MITGFLLIDKAKGPSSHDVVQVVRAVTGERRVGHTGTLDPFATGLLPICLGRATRLARFLSSSVKTYSALVRFGFATDTYDVTGRRVGSESIVSLDEEALAPLLASFVGKQGQVPPPFAAKKVQGRRMYQMARAGIVVEPKPVEVVIRRIDLLGVHGSRATIDVEVEAGTYIRSLAHDLGQRLGCGAHLEELRRTGVGPHNIERALSLEDLETLTKSGRLEDALMTPADALSELPWIRLSGEERHKIGHGRRISISVDEASRNLPRLEEGQSVRLMESGGGLVAVGIVTEGLETIHPLVVLQPGSSNPPADVPIHVD